MPTVINIKELTASDDIVQISEKVNYNFERLLELGVGSPGPTGNPGPQGVPGPPGARGLVGIRGTRWFFGSESNPALHNFGSTTLVDGDIYTDQIFNVYQYDLNSAIWNQVLDPNTVFAALVSSGINNVMIRGFSIAGTVSTDVASFVGFKNFNGVDRTFVGINPIQNDSMFLHNFDQLLVPEFAATPQHFWTALQSIYSNHLTGNDDQQVRSHILLGSLYSGESSVQTLTSEDQSLKIKHIVENDTPTATDPTQKRTFISRFSAARRNGSDPLTSGKFNSAFNFRMQSWGTSVYETDIWMIGGDKFSKQVSSQANLSNTSGLAIKKGGKVVVIGIDSNNNAVIGTDTTTGLKFLNRIVQASPTLNLIELDADIATIGDRTLTADSSGAFSISSGDGSVILKINNTGQFRIGSIVSATYRPSIKTVPSLEVVNIGAPKIDGISAKMHASTVEDVTGKQNIKFNGSIATTVRKIASDSDLLFPSFAISDVLLYDRSIIITNDLTNSVLYLPKSYECKGRDLTIVNRSTKSIVINEIGYASNPIMTVPKKTTFNVQSSPVDPGTNNGAMWELMSLAEVESTATIITRIELLEKMLKPLLGYDDPSNPGHTVYGSWLFWGRTVAEIPLGWEPVPDADWKGKFPVVLDQTDPSFDTIGATGGEKNHTLTIPEMPGHSHTLHQGNSYTGGGGFGVVGRGADSPGTMQTESNGSGESHNNLPPYKVVMFIRFAG